MFLRGVDPAAFRHHAGTIEPPPSPDALTAIAVDGKTLRGGFDALGDRKVAHMMSALRQADQIVLGHLMVHVGVQGLFHQSLLQLVQQAIRVKGGLRISASQSWSRMASGILGSLRRARGAWILE